MGATTGVFEAWREAMLAGDADAIAELYEDDAVLVIPSYDVLARGRQAIRDAWAELLATGPVESIDVSEHEEMIDGDIAWVMAVGVIKGEIDGESVEIPFTATDVQRRGADGRWRYVLDHG